MEVPQRETKPGADVLLGIDGHDVYEESSGGEEVSVLIEQRHMSVSCVKKKKRMRSERGEYEELFVQRVN